MCFNIIDVSQQNRHQSEVIFFSKDMSIWIPRLIKKVPGRPFIIIDEVLIGLYPHLLHSLTGPILQVATGENVKTLAAAEKIIHFLQDNQCHRYDSLIVIGGGCLGDVAGFVASIYKRGMSWFFFPTTLIAQIDSSIGGKVAINTSDGKNQLGSFWPAQGVYIFDEFLKTVDRRHYNAGVAEAIKVALLSGCNLLTLLEQEDIPSRTELVYLSVKAKLKVIKDDWLEEKEGTRIGLNFGHTIGHALEKMVPDLLHGEAIAIGMVTELYLAIAKGETVFCVQRLKALLSRFDLPTKVQPYLTTAGWPSFTKAISQDKKNETEDVCFVIPTKAGLIKKMYISLVELKINLF